MRGIGLVIGAALFVGIIALAKPDGDAPPRPKLPAMGSEVVLDVPFWACAKLDDLKKIAHLVTVEKDTKAATVYGSRRCAVWAAGVKGKVTDLSVFSNAVCSRRAGEPECRWTQIEMLK